MKKIAFIILVQFFLLVSSFSQERGGNPKFDLNMNPYEKIMKDTATGKRTAKFLMNFIQPEVLRDYFTSSPCTEYTQLSDTRINQFNEFVQKFVTGRIDAKQMTKAENDFKKRGVAAHMTEIDYHIGFIEKQGTFSADGNTPVENLICRARGSVQAIKSIVNYLEALKILFPAIQGIDEVIQKGNQALLSYPDNKSLLAIIKKNKSK
ncbi:MAG TPA: hypothetical protein DHW64_07265 [Chitinophagaceae bacterium]|nr:hypothetical protein [Chitinophagaceae bacterium]